MRSAYRRLQEVEKISESLTIRQRFDLKPLGPFASCTLSTSSLHHLAFSCGGSLLVDERL